MTLRLASVVVTAVTWIGCGGEGPTTPDPGSGPAATATLSGIVREGGRVTQTAIANATVRAGSISTTTGSDGRFALQNLPVGTVAIEVEAEGFDLYTRQIALREGANAHDVLLVRSLTIHEQGEIVLALPPETSVFEAVIFWLPGSGGDTRPFVRGEDDRPEAMDLRRRFLVLAEIHGLAFMGSNHMPNQPETHEQMLETLADLADASGHPELSDAPLLLIGHSAGGCLADLFTRSHADRVLGFISMKGGCHLLQDAGAAKAVPAYFFIGELDTESRRQNITAHFERNRADGALWALAIEPLAGHQVVEDGALLANWFDVVLQRRLPPAGGAGTLPPIDETTGWLGDRDSFAIAAHDCYTGDKGTASWLPSEATARDWQALVSKGAVTAVVDC